MENKQAPDGYRVLKEGQASILYIEQKMEKDSEGFIKANNGKRIANEINETRGAVFYNPVQEFNRDISILTIREFIKMQRAEFDAKGKDYCKDGVAVLEALAATGLRSVRYLKEIPMIRNLVTNDWDPKAVELIQKNMDFNNIDKTKYETHARDAVDLLNEMRA
jgi:tRNA (guanine26-N2/guanine27-N2)-dimethyltransferase